MKIRKAEERDVPRLLALLGQVLPVSYTHLTLPTTSRRQRQMCIRDRLGQVLQIHAEIRPDVFIPGTTKYTVCELTELLKQEDKPIYVAVNEDDVCMGCLLYTSDAADD